MGVFVIADIGSNHCGDLWRAKDLVSAAADAGVDAVKFQAFDESIWESKEAWAKRAPFAVGKDFLEGCYTFAERVGVEFMCTPCYPGAVRWLDRLVKRWKVASGDVGRVELTELLDMTRKPVLYSLGLGSLIGKDQWIPMVCVSRYPANGGDYDLGRWGVDELPWGLSDWGISDHTTHHSVIMAAISRGAMFVEKHIKFIAQPHSPDDGPWAYTTSQFKGFVRELREVEKALDNCTSSPEGLTAKGRKVWALP